jgi:hypothetical protein
MVLPIEAQQSKLRIPAIPKEHLRLPNGEYANKKTLQEIALAAGLPVPPIIYDDNKPGYRRGYFPHPVDMWAVDILPTSYIDNHSDHEWFDEKLSNEALDTQPFLKVNFGISKRFHPESFLQEKVNGRIYVSTLGRGPNIFVSVNLVGNNKGTNWAHYLDGTLQNAKPEYASEITDQVIGTIEKTNKALDSALRGKYEYKHDFLYEDRDNIHLIQSRVAGPKITEENIHQESLKVNGILQQGVKQIHVEVAEISTIASKLLEGPCVLRLTNDRHEGITMTDIIHSLDLRNIAGLQLPEGLAGGLLQHNAYIIIAYTLYWGIPIKFI